MVRSFAVACVLSCVAASAWAQAQPALGTAATQPGTPATKPAFKKTAQKTKTTAKPPVPADNGPCQLGVIPAVGDQFVFQKVGFTVFGNEQTEVPIDGWGLNDVVVARVRAAAPGIAVRRIAHEKDAFAHYVQPAGLLFRDAKTELNDIVRQVAADTHCERYVLVTRLISQFSNTNQAVRGIGIVNWGNPIKSRTYLFALTYIRVFDGQDFNIIKRGAASTDDESLASRMLLLTPVRGPNRELDEASFPSAPAEVANNPALRDGVRALLTASLDKTLPALLGQ
jgi:hypothetical protein